MRLSVITDWIMELFNPPLRDSLSLAQKMGRVLLVTITLVTLSIIAALGLAVAIYIYDGGRRFLASIPNLTGCLEILGVSLVVNIVCISLILYLKVLDRRLMREAPPGES